MVEETSDAGEGIVRRRPVEVGRIEGASLEIFAGLEPGSIDRLTDWLLGFAFAFLIFALIYKVTPYIKTRWRQVLPGAFLGAAVFELGKRGFVFYLGRVANLEAVYGSLSSIIVLLLWLYVSALVLLLGAEYNTVRWRERKGNRI